MRCAVAMVTLLAAIPAAAVTFHKGDVLVAVRYSGIIFEGIPSQYTQWFTPDGELQLDIPAVAGDGFPSIDRSMNAYVPSIGKVVKYDGHGDIASLLILSEGE